MSKIRLILIIAAFALFDYCLFFAFNKFMEKHRAEERSTSVVRVIEEIPTEVEEPELSPKPEHLERRMQRKKNIQPLEESLTVHFSFGDEPLQIGDPDFITTNLPPDAIQPLAGTLMMWVKIPEPEKSLPLFSAKIDGTNTRLLWWNGQTGQWFGGVDTVTNAASRSAHTDLDGSKWHHLALAWDLDEGIQCLYVDGEQVGAYSFVYLKDPTQAVWELPTLGFASGERVAFVDGVRCFSRALYPEEVMQFAQQDIPPEEEVEAPPVVELSKKISSKVVWHKVASIRCADKPPKDSFLSRSSTEVVRTRMGNYRKSSPEKIDWFAYRFDVEHPEKPHRISVGYPDDAPRTMAFGINDSSGDAPQGAGVRTGNAMELSGKMLRQDLLFWPQSNSCLFTVFNWSDEGGDAAISALGVYELESDVLPPLEVPQTGRSFGRWMPEASLPELEHLAEYMQYTGQNLYEYPITWIDGSLFPCPTQDRFGFYSTRRGSHPDGTFDQMLSVFEQHAITLLPILYFQDIPALFLQTESGADMLPPEDRELWNQRVGLENGGDDDMFQVLRDGTRRAACRGLNGLPGSAPVGPVFNPLHPTVQHVLLGTVKDWLDRYGDCPAMGGLVLDLGAGGGGMPQADSLLFDRLDSGYSDFTVALFEKDTGIDVPGDPDDEERFAQRYAFLTSGEMRSKWLDWRCAQIRDKVILPVARLVWERRPDLRVVLAVGSRAGIGSPLLENKTTWLTAARECGIDPALYFDFSRLSFQRHGVDSLALGNCDSMDEQKVAWPSSGGVQGPSSSDWRVSRPWKVMESAREKWPEVQPTVGAIRTIADRGNGIFESTAAALQKRDLFSVVCGGKGEPVTLGHDAETMRFVRAFRSLPAVGFEDVEGLADPVRVRQAEHEGVGFAYLVNADRFAAGVKLRFSGDPGRIENLATGEPLEVDAKNQLTLAVEPYELVSLRLENPVRIVGGDEGVSRAAMEPLLKTFTQLKAQIASQMEQYVPQNPEALYLWHEAEQWNEWEAENQLTSSWYTRMRASGRSDIILDDDEFPVVYQLDIPVTNRYALWVRHSAPSRRSLYTSDWDVSLDGEELGEWMSPCDEKVSWVSVGTFEIPEGKQELVLHYRNSGRSAPLDLFLLTTDLEYVPHSRANPDQRVETLKTLLNETETELRSKHTVTARSLLSVLESMVE